MNQRAGVDFSRLETAETPRASALRTTMLPRPKSRTWPSAARACQKNRQSGASKFPKNHARAYRAEPGQGQQPKGRAEFAKQIIAARHGLGGVDEDGVAGQIARDQRRAWPCPAQKCSRASSRCRRNKRARSASCATEISGMVLQPLRSASARRPGVAGLSCRDPFAPRCCRPPAIGRPGTTARPSPRPAIQHKTTRLRMALLRRQAARPFRAMTQRRAQMPTWAPSQCW